MTRRSRFGFLPTASCLLPTVLILLTAHCSLLTIRAQSATATLSGTIEDPNGAVVAGAKVKVINLGTGLERDATTNDSGTFTIPLLPPSTYTVRVERDGFVTIEVSDVILNVNDEKSLKIQMKVGDVKEVVNVTGEASLIDESTAIGTVVDRNFAENLPLNGRSFQSLLTLAPGVTITSAANEGGQFSVNGQRTNTNAFLIDGVGANISAPFSAGGNSSTAQSGALPGLNAFGGTSNLLSVDALEEFRIQTSSYSAEFGRQPGGQVSLVSRSGKNAFHGSLFEYFRNEALDARNYFNRKPTPKTPLRQNLFGGTFGGPIFFPRLGDGGPAIYDGRNRTFFFLSYEGLRLRLPLHGVANVPSLRLRNNAAPAVRHLLDAFPIPLSTTPELVNAAGVPLGRTPYDFGVSNPSASDSTGIRIDHRISDNLNVFGRLNVSPSSSVTRFATSLTNPSRNKGNTQTLTLATLWAASSSFSNDVRFNYSHNTSLSDRFFESLGGATPIELADLTTGYAGGGSHVSGSVFFSPVQSTFTLGTSVDSLQEQINVVDNVTFVQGRHNLRFGVDYRRLAPVFATQEYSQSLSFNNETAIQTAIANSIFINKLDTVRPVFQNFSAYVQDSWKLMTRFTLDLGLRWELNPPPSEKSGRKPVTVIGLDNIQTATLAPTDAPIFNTDYTAFAPRLGAAYQLTSRNGWETVLRGGFGVFYDLGSGRATSGFRSAPFFANISRTNVPYPVSPALAQPPIIGPITLPTTATFNSSDPDLKPPYTLQWNLATEQSLGKQQSLSLSYVGSAGRRLLLTRLVNFSFGGPRLSPNFGTIAYTTNGGESDYHAFQAQFQRRLSGGLQALVNYTWSHAIDNISDELFGSALTRGNSAFDVRHNFSAAVTYNVPKIRSLAFVEYILNGWSLDAIVRAQSGFPIDLATSTPNFVGPDGIGISRRPDYVLGQPLYINDPTVPGGRRFNPAAFRLSPVVNGVPQQGTFGRNVLRGLPIYQTDLALRRQFGLTERLKLQLKAEAFNIFNHPMFEFYGTAFANTATFGVPSLTLNNSLGGLNALYQVGGPRSIQLSARLYF